MQVDAGTEASKTLAEAIANATPEELASLNAFAAANFLSPQLIQQLLGTGGDMLQVIKQGMDGATISPDFIVDLSAAQVVGVLQTGQIPVHGGFSDTPGAPLPSTPPAGVTQNFEFNYNAQTESELGTATSQSTQTIQAVARGIQRIR